MLLFAFPDSVMAETFKVMGKAGLVHGIEGIPTYNIRLGVPRRKVLEA